MNKTRYSARRPLRKMIDIFYKSLRGPLSRTPSVAGMIQNVPSEISSEFRSDVYSDELARCVTILYNRCLGRKPEEAETQEWISLISRGRSIVEVIQDIDSSDEAQLRRNASSFGTTCSDGEFLLSAGELLYGRGLTPPEVEHWKRYLSEQPERRDEFVRSFVNAHIAEQFKTHEQAAVSAHDPSKCMILGTSRFLTRTEWDTRAQALVTTSAKHDEALVAASVKQNIVRRNSAPSRFEHSGDYAVSAIASMYKGKRYLENFLENITSQTFFDRSELIFIDANSPENEEQTIRSYQDRFPNIIYRRINYRIGVYDAWNIGVELARGRYITNTNLDDLRRRDSFEIQASVLDQNKDVDVVYQDFFYSMDPSLSFDEVAAFGFKSELPIITPHNLLVFNSPHNAPMWRKELHDELGLFDTSFRSAGDYEFWIRCMSHSKRFKKINTPHVVYYQNPEGISTNKDTNGVEEVHRILKRYSRKLISKELLKTRADLGKSLGVQPAESANYRDQSYYNLVQQELNRLGEKRWSNSSEIIRS